MLNLILPCKGNKQKQIFGKSWEFGPTGLTPLPVRWDFFRDFFWKMSAKKGQIYYKTVIYKSCDWVRPPPPPSLLGPNSQLLPKICFGGFPYHYINQNQALPLSTSLTLIWNRQCMEMTKTTKLPRILFRARLHARPAYSPIIRNNNISMPVMAVQKQWKEVAHLKTSSPV